VVLDGEEGRVEDDADGHRRLEQRVVHHFEKEVLKSQPKQGDQRPFGYNMSSPLGVMFAYRGELGPQG
jgi:hypothetical protein